MCSLPPRNTSCVGTEMYPPKGGSTQIALKTCIDQISPYVTTYHYLYYMMKTSTNQVSHLAELDGHLADLHYDTTLEWSFCTSSALELSLTNTSASEWSFATSAALKLSLTFPSAVEWSIATSSALESSLDHLLCLGSVHRHHLCYGDVSEDRPEVQQKEEEKMKRGANVYCIQFQP